MWDMLCVRMQIVAKLGYWMLPTARENGDRSWYVAEFSDTCKHNFIALSNIMTGPASTVGTAYQVSFLELLATAHLLQHSIAIAACLIA